MDSMHCEQQALDIGLVPVRPGDVGSRDPVPDLSTQLSDEIDDLRARLARRFMTQYRERSDQVVMALGESAKTEKRKPELLLPVRHLLDRMSEAGSSANPRMLCAGT